MPGSRDLDMTRGIEGVKKRHRVTQNAGMGSGLLDGETADVFII